MKWVQAPKNNYGHTLINITEWIRPSWHLINAFGMFFFLTGNIMLGRINKEDIDSSVVKAPACITEEYWIKIFCSIWGVFNEQLISLELIHCFLVTRLERSDDHGRQVKKKPPGKNPTKWRKLIKIFKHLFVYGHAKQYLFHLQHKTGINSCVQRQKCQTSIKTGYKAAILYSLEKKTPRNWKEQMSEPKSSTSMYIISYCCFRSPESWWHSERG